MGSSSLFEEDRFILIGTFALASHLFVFRLVELWPIQLAKLYSTLFLLDASYRHFCTTSSIFSSILSSFVDLVAYTTFVLTSIGIYRLFFHRISNLPGPRSWALTKWATFRADLHGVRPRVVHDAHVQYGDVVRTGPREVSINSPFAVSAITSAKSDCFKGPWYVSASGGRESWIVRNVLTTLDRSEHDRRRKAWDTAFSAKALKGYEPALLNNMDTMLKQLAKRAKEGSVVDIDDWGVLFAFDLICQVGFGQNLGLLEKGKLSPILENLEHTMKFQQVINNRPYMVEIARKLPNPVAEFTRMVLDQLEEREKHKHEQAPDIMTFLYESGGQAQGPSESSNQSAEEFYKSKRGTNTLPQASSEARLIIIAGSDTSSTVMAMTMYLLLQHPEVAQKLRKELDGVFGTDFESTITDFTQLDRTCPLLNAVINESMRLFPPLAAGLQKANSKGSTIIELLSGEKVVVPKDVVITTPTYTMQRDPRNFSPEPNSFRPERWLNPEKEEKFERKAFVPFSAGATLCVGKLLAYMELRLVIANLVRRFEMKAAEGFDAEEFEDGVRDCFVSTRLKKLSVTLTDRALAQK